jgi:hypothetical protein
MTIRRADFFNSPDAATFNQGLKFMAKISTPNPFTTLPPRYLPSNGTPTRINTPEQGRAEQIPAGIASGAHAPRYGDRPGMKPFPERVPVITNSNPGPRAGGSES